MRQYVIIVSNNIAILSQNSEIVSHYYEILSYNYEIVSHYYEICLGDLYYVNHRLCVCVCERESVTIVGSILGRTNMQRDLGSTSLFSETHKTIKQERNVMTMECWSTTHKQYPTKHR